MVALADPAPLPKAHSITISPVTIADLPAITECELLAFDGTDAVGALLTPLRPALAASRVHPRHWPDYAPALRRRARQLLEGGALLVKAEVALSLDGDGNAGERRVAGFAKLHLPRTAQRARSWQARVLGDYVYPAVDAVRGRVAADADGTDEAALALFRAQLKAGREEVMAGRDWFILELLVVHPDCQRRGVGAALLAHCTALSDAAGVPMLLESSEAGRALYASRGFTMVRMSRMEYGGAVASWPVMVREPVGKAEAAEPGSELGLS